jgi:integrase
MALTNTQLKNLHGKKDKACTLPDRQGLSAVISPLGHIIFQYRFRWINKQARMKLGTYPAFSLDKARATVIEYKSLLEQGYDPRQHKQRLLAKNQQALTVKDGLEYWLENHAKTKRSDYIKLLPLFKKYVYTQVGKFTLDTMKMCHWDLVFENPELLKHPVQAGKLLGLLQTAMRFLLHKHKAECVTLETLRVRDVGEVAAKGQRHLLDHELGQLWRFVNGKDEHLENNRWKLKKRTLIIVKLIMAFGDRTKELRIANKSDFNLEQGIWTVTNAKAKNTIIRPIHASLFNDIKDLIAMHPHTPLLLPPTNKPYSLTPVTSGALVGIPKLINKRLKLDDWAMHDLRRTIKTHMRNLGVERDVTEKILGHVQKGVDGNYDLHGYLDEQLAAYTLWIDHLDGLIE